MIDNDTYILGEDAHLNIKIRSRTRTLKVKELADQTDDGFELWRTRSDMPLPAASDTWEDVASRLSIELDTSFLATLSHPRNIVEALCGAMQGVRCLHVRKNRTSFVAPRAELEVVKIVVAGRAFQSIAFESRLLSCARSLRTHMEATTHGTPENYVAFCSRILRSVSPT